MKNNIINTNDNGQPHGYQEVYWRSSRLLLKCLYYNGIQVYYEECYKNGIILVKKRFYI